MVRDGWSSGVLAPTVALWATLVLGYFDTGSAPVTSKIQLGLLNAGYINRTIPTQSNFESVFVRVLRDINTECKACPHPGCVNKEWFGSSHQFAAKCWTAGTTVGNTK